MKKMASVILAILLISVYSVSAFAEFAIEDSALLESMKQYDLNNDGVIEVSEFNSVILSEGRTLILDNNRFTSAKGLEKAYFAEKIFMRNCEFKELPIGISEILPKELHLENNNLSDSEELLDILKIRGTGKKCIFIEGNPCSEEVIYKDFKYRFYNLSIVGAVGETYWQKTNDRSELRVDLMDSNDFNDINWTDRVIGEADFLEMDWEFSIEDTSIAQIEGEGFLERDFAFNGAENFGSGVEIFLENQHQQDPIIKVKLLKEGRTRMKITCGDYVKYTDIIVLPEHTDDCGLYAIPSISDMEMLNLIKNNTEQSYSGIYRASYDYFNKENLVINGDEAYIKDLTSFSDMYKLGKLTFTKYSDEMLKQLTGINDIPNLYCVEVYLNDSDDTSSLFEYVDENISDIKGAGWVTLNRSNRIEVRNLDVNEDERISARDALSVLKDSVGLTEFDLKQAQIADVNNDDTINASDALEILKIIAKVK